MISEIPPMQSGQSAEKKAEEKPSPEEKQEIQRYLRMRGNMADNLRSTSGELPGRVQGVELGDISPEEAKERFAAMTKKMNEEYSELVDAAARVREINES